MRCILDTGPIIALAKVGYLDLVYQLFDIVAMKCAHEFNIKTLRTDALLVAAAKNNLITVIEVRKSIEVLRKEHYFDLKAEHDILALLNDDELEDVSEYYTNTQ